MDLVSKTLSLLYVSFLFLEGMSSFCGPLTPLFCTSGDASSGFQSQGTAADPGFSKRCQTKGGAGQPIIWPKFVDNCMIIKKIGPREGARPKFYYVDPPSG